MYQSMVSSRESVPQSWMAALITCTALYSDFEPKSTYHLLTPAWAVRCIAGVIVSLLNLTLAAKP